MSLAANERAADEAATEEERSAAKQLVAFLRGTGQGVLTAMVTHWITGA